MARVEEKCGKTGLLHMENAGNWSSHDYWLKYPKDEPENPETVKEFSEKIGVSLKRMEELIQSMLKITRLDTGNIVFEKRNCPVTELISRSISELTDRAKTENKQIILKGNSEQTVFCDLEWKHCEKRFRPHKAGRYDSNFMGTYTGDTSYFYH
jgi:signal transduction histidine kinase